MAQNRNAPASQADRLALPVLEGMAAGTQVLTVEGMRGVETLLPGDRLVTRAGACRLVQIEVTRLENARVVRIRPDTLGQGRPGAEVTLAAGQTLFLRDWRARALYGAEQVAVPAARLADGAYIRRETLPEARLYTLSFAQPQVIYAEGLELCCTGVAARA